jgi:hypothetical protein
MTNFAFGMAPVMMGMELMRAAPRYNAQQAIQPKLKHDFDAQRTKTVEFFRFNRWAEAAMTKDARRRNKTSLIGTANSVGLQSDPIKMTIFEMTGPSAANGDPAALWITLEDILFARANLMQYGVAGFHESIGSANLADDYNAFMDRIHILETMNTTIRLNPGNKADASTLVTDRATSTDLDRMLYQLQIRNTPVFPDGLYHCLMDLVMVFHLMQDTDFKSTAFALMQNGQAPLMSQAGMSQMPSMLQVPMVGSTVPMGMPGQQSDQSPIRPLIYKNLLIFPSTNIPKRTVNSLEASLATAFGPDCVAFGSGGKGVQVKINADTDYNRHFRYIWSHFCDVQYMLNDTVSSGCAVELRSFGAV